MSGIGWAVKQMRDGQKVCRAGWNGKGMWLAYASGGSFKSRHPTMTPDPIMGDLEPFIFMLTAQKNFIPWLCSQADLLATDWELAE